MTTYIQRTLRLDIQDWTEQYEEFKTFMEFYSTDIRSAYVVYEIAKKTGKLHIQGIVECVDDKDRYDAMRSYIIRNIYKGKAPKGIYSFAKVKDYEDYMTYLSKGEEKSSHDHVDDFVPSNDPVVIYKKGYQDSVISAFRLQAVSQQQEHLKKQSDIKKKYKVLTGATKCLAYLEEHRSSFIDDEGYLDQAKMAHIIISFFRNTSVVHDRIIFRKFYNLANNHFNPKCHVRTMLGDLRYETTLSKVLVSTGRSVGESLHLKYNGDEYDELEKELISNEVLNNDE